MDMRATNTLRVLPRLNEFLNEEWITDKARFCYDGLASQRLTMPLVRRNLEAGFLKVSWLKLFNELRLQYPLSEYSVDVLVGGAAAFENLTAAKHLFLGARFINEAVVGNPKLTLNQDLQEFYLFNSSYNAFKDADIFLVLGSNLRFDAPSVNLKIRRAVRADSSKRVFAAGFFSSFTYPVVNLGGARRFWSRFSAGKHKFVRLFCRSKAPYLVFGPNSGVAPAATFALVDSSARFNLTYRPSWNGLNFLSMTASQNAYNDLALEPRPSVGVDYSKGLPSFTYSLASDNIRSNVRGNGYRVYQGHNGDWGAANANVVVPTLHPYETFRSTFSNIYGKLQVVSRSQFSLDDLVSDSLFLKYIARAFDIDFRRGFTSRSLVRFGVLREFSFTGSFEQEHQQPNSWGFSNVLDPEPVYSYLKLTSRRVRQMALPFHLCDVPVPLSLDVNEFGNSPYSYSLYFTDAVSRSSHLMALGHGRFKESSVFLTF